MTHRLLFSLFAATLTLPTAANAGNWWDIDLDDDLIPMLIADLLCEPLRLPDMAEDEIIIEITNVGSAVAASTWLDVFIDIDLPLVEVGDTSDLYVRTKQLAPGQSTRYTFWAPAHVVEGADPHYHYACVIDTFDQVLEVDETENNAYNTYRQVF